MNLRSSLPLPLLLAATAALAQPGATASAPVEDAQTTRFQTPQGELIVHTGQPAPRDYGPPPAFAQLGHRGSGFLSAADADAYPPLANDFIHADANRDGRISRAEYERWARAR